ncbi:MAG TPA: hypothetical protein VFQ39_05385 [Longimicrobium sp.]|nr:hypothetical protein [Longimicrobium sp.]
MTQTGARIGAKLEITREIDAPEVSPDDEIAERIAHWLRREHYRVGEEEGAVRFDSGMHGKGNANPLNLVGAGRIEVGGGRITVRIRIARLLAYACIPASFGTLGGIALWRESPVAACLPLLVAGAHGVFLVSLVRTGFPRAIARMAATPVEPSPRALTGASRPSRGGR